MRRQEAMLAGDRLALSGDVLCTPSAAIRLRGSKRISIYGDYKSDRSSTGFANALSYWMYHRHVHVEVFY